MASRTEIEKLAVKLELDAKQYQKGLTQAIAGTDKYVQDVNGRIRDLKGKFVRTHREMVQGAILAVASGMKKISSIIASTGKKISRFGRSLTLKVTLPIVAVGALSVRAFSKFDNAMTESTSIMGKDVIPHTQAMRDLALELGSKGVKGPIELAESYFFLASAGKNAEQSMALLPAIINFATAGAFDMALATDLLTDAQSALGLSSKDAAEDLKNMTRLSDVLVKTNTIANASVQQFSESLTADAATASKIINAELETTIAILAIYADKGKKAAESGNLFGRAVRLLTKSARDNADEFSKRNIKVIDEVSGEYRNFIDIIDDMNKAFDGLTGPEIGKALSDLGFEALAQKSILPLLGATDQLKFYEKELKNAAGITKEVADKQLKSFSNQFIILKNRIMAAAIEIGDTLAPTLLKLNKIVAKGLEAWKELNPKVKRMAIIAAVVAAAIGPLLIILGGLVGVAASVVGAFAAVVTAMAATIGAVVALLTPTGLIIVAVALLAVTITAIMASFVDWGEVLDGFKLKWEGIKKEAEIAIGGIQDALKSGDFKLAAEIAWAGLKIAWAKGIFSVEVAWITFLARFKAEFIKAKAFVTNQFKDLITGLAVGKTGKAALDFLGLDPLGKGDVNQQAMKDLAENATDAAKAVLEIANNIGKLKRERDTLLKKASDAIPAVEAKKPSVPKGAKGKEGAGIPPVPGLTDEEIADTKKIQDRADAIKKQFRTSEQVFADAKKELDVLFKAGKIDIGTYTRALEDAEKQMDKDYQVDFSVKGVDAVAAGSAEAITRLQEFRDTIRQRNRVKKFKVDPAQVLGFKAGLQKPGANIVGNNVPADQKGAKEGTLNRIAVAMDLLVDFERAKENGDTIAIADL